MAKKQYRGRYRVVGLGAVLGHEPGSTFEHDFDPGHEHRLITAGHIAVVKPQEKEEK